MLMRVPEVLPLFLQIAELQPVMVPAVVVAEQELLQAFPV
jgi:hypothetical protein